MADRPVIVIVDDEPGALAAMLNALTRRFGADYRVAPHLSAREALNDLVQIRKEGEEIALVVADQWMPEMNGNEFLAQAHALAPGAKRALLVAWGDRSASRTILQGCALGELDNYLYKPWAPAEVHLYPLVSEFLAEWTRLHRPAMELVQVVGDELSPRSNEIREFLGRNGVPHGFYAAGSPAATRLLEENGISRPTLPIVIQLDGSTLSEPTNSEIADSIGGSPHELACDVAVIGAGPAGLAAAVYAGSEGLRTLVVERYVVGGQAGASSLIRNYLGFPRGISGAELAQRAYQQAWLFGAKYVFAREVVGLRAEDGARILSLSDGREITARAVVIATGARYRRLEVPSIERFAGQSLFYTTFGDPRPVYGLDVVVVGGGNSAGQAVVHLSRFARQVTLVARAESLEKGMSDYLVQQIRRARNVDVRLGAEVVDAEGGQRIERISVRHADTGVVDRVPVQLLFVLIGSTPHTDWLDGAIQRNEKGYLATGSDVAHDRWPLFRPPMRLETSMPGVFAAGDVRLGSLQRVAAAVGEGAIVVQHVHEYLKREEETAQGTYPSGLEGGGGEEAHASLRLVG
ncbi:MAG TPA: FAD-dependent oxidoreductase [Anaeromyxobacteraceae bacterium]|nr:FAD-dependent oxidoreductase [Anaeromyxobacteraceae bacterium]